MKKLLVGLLLLLAIATVTYMAMPRYAAGQLVEAARLQDTQGVEQLVDFPRLRENLKQRLQAQLRSSVGDAFPPEFGDLVTAGSGLFITPVLRGLITPAGIADILSGGDSLHQFERELYPPPSANDDAAEASADETRHWQLQRWRYLALDRVAVDFGQAEDPHLRLFFSRRGWHWLLTDMALLEGEGPQ
ncbi:DUF2939 domain-containing protein [Microbulbifer discodermiae]|uniref:DUF2939 domain-containing protein n=1 Tax=Microbulbifer sp. 2201CG32-9 TaxID=3232309 RepID=UPI00345B8FC8